MSNSVGTGLIVCFAYARPCRVCTSVVMTRSASSGRADYRLWRAARAGHDRGTSKLTTVGRRAGLATHTTNESGGSATTNQPATHQPRVDRVPRRVEMDHALLLPLLRSQRSPSRARRFAVGGRAVRIRGGSVIF